MPGDDLSSIDWKVYARSDRYYVKKFEEETNVDCHLLLDVSASMGYGSRGITKLQYGSMLAASLAYLMNRQRDAVGAHDVRRRDRDDGAAERAAEPPAVDPGDARSDGARAPDRRVEAAAPARGRHRQARHGRPHFRPARRAGAGGRRAPALPVPRHRRHRVSRDGSRRADVSRSSGPRGSATWRWATR